MANIKELIQSIEAADSSFDEKLNAINQMEETLVAMRQQEQEAINDNVDLIVEAINVMQKKVDAQLVEIQAIIPEKGDKGDKGKDGKQGKDGLDGKDGKDGLNGKDGQDGKDGVSVTDAKIDFDGSLVITLSTGQEINVGEVVAPELQEKIKLVTSGGAGTVLPTQTGNANKYLKTDGTALSWAAGDGTGTVTSVGGTGTVNGLTLTGTVTTSGNLTLGGTLDLSSPPAIGGTTPSTGTFTTLTATGQTSLGGASGSESLRVLTPISAAGLRLQVGVPSSTVVRLGPAGGSVADFRILAPSFINFFTGSSSDGLSDGNAQMRVTHTASAVNYVQVTGAATGGAPAISAQGSDSSVSMTFQAKGVSGILAFGNVGGGNNHAFKISTGAAVNTGNAIQVTGSVAGAGPTISAVSNVSGTDANIDINLTPKGTGVLSFGTYTASVLTPTGYITIKDSGGTSRRLLVG